MLAMNFVKNEWNVIISKERSKVEKTKRRTKKFFSIYEILYIHIYIHIYVFNINI